MQTSHVQNLTETQNTVKDATKNTVGRFAPSPTGALHLGSLFTAVASFLSAKSAGGTWLVRLEDTDFERCKQEHSDTILHTLEAFGLRWDAVPSYQSKHLADYDAALAKLADAQLAYGCSCSRKSLRNHAEAQGVQTHPYPKLCIGKHLELDGVNVRATIPEKTYTFFDQLQDRVATNPAQTLGDAVIRRRNGIYNYVFTSVVDDAIQGVTQIVRGIDLFGLTAVQLALAELLGLKHGFVASSSFTHLPVIVNRAGQKLSKQNKAVPVDTKNAAAQLHHVLKLLGQKQIEKDTPEAMLNQATEQWDVTTLKYIDHINPMVEEK